ncbi:MAG TPA: STELLO glycosyltransferase family protein [Polyangia bacterium]
MGALARGESRSSFVVITSIHPPSAAVRAFADLPGWQVIVVADRKTPPWPQLGGKLAMLTLEAQMSLPGRLGPQLPFDHYARKNLGYLAAIRAGATCIADTDDDNAPLRGWGSGLTDAPQTLPVVVAPRMANVHTWFGDEVGWPRGFPLEEVLPRRQLTVEPRAGVRVMVWQGLVEGDPDVDAIYRLTHGRPLRFFAREPIALAPGVYCPFNSQNTIWFPDAFPFLFLPTTVTLRFSDILRGYIAQRGLHAMNGAVGFLSPSARQERNPHNLLRDFVDELPCYTDVARVVGLLEEEVLSGDPCRDLVTLYASLARAGIVADRECDAVAAWLADLESAKRDENDADATAGR